MHASNFTANKHSASPHPILYVSVSPLCVFLLVCGHFLLCLCLCLFLHICIRTKCCSRLCATTISLFFVWLDINYSDSTQNFSTHIFQLESFSAFVYSGHRIPKRRPQDPGPFIDIPTAHGAQHSPWVYIFVKILSIFKPKHISVC